MTLDIRLQRRTDRVVWSLAAAFGLFAMHAAFATPPAVAAPPATPAATYRQECGDCHVAYAPRLLPAGDWRRLMAGLDRHFGSDASLDPATTTAILGWLEAGAAPAGSRRDHESRPGRDMPAIADAGRRERERQLSACEKIIEDQLDKFGLGGR